MGVADPGVDVGHGDGAEEGVGGVVAEQVGDDPVGNPQGPGEEGPVLVLDHHQPALHQRGGGAEPAAAAAGRSEGAAQLQGQADAGPAAGDVVVQVPVEALEPGVDVGGEGHQEEVGVEVGEVEGEGQAAEAQVGARGLGDVGGGLDRGQQGLRAAAAVAVAVGREERQAGPGQEPVDLGVGRVEAPEAVVGIGVVAPSAGDPGADPRLHHRQPTQQVPDRRVDGRTWVRRGFHPRQATEPTRPSRRPWGCTRGQTSWPLRASPKGYHPPMGASVVLTPERVGVTPGSTATASVRVRNDGNLVDVFTVDVVGETSGWTTVEPASLNLYPGAQGTVEVRFQPPRSTAVAAGAKPFGVRVRSQEDPGFSVVEEGLVDVAPFTELGATLVPQTVETSGSAKARVRLANGGNVPAAVTLRVEDPDEALAASVTPATVALAPGQEATAQVSLRARDTFLRGPTRSRPYSVVVDHSGSEPIRVTGTLVQKPVISAGWVKLATGLLALGVVAALFLLTQKDDKPLDSDPTGSSQTTNDGDRSDTTRRGGAGGDGTTTSAPSTSMATTTTLAFTERPIVYASLEDGPDSDIWAIQPDGNGLRQLTDEDDDETDPALSPDGKRIAFVRDDGATPTSTS